MKLGGEADDEEEQMQKVKRLGGRFELQIRARKGGWDMVVRSFDPLRKGGNVAEMVGRGVYVRMNRASMYAQRIVID